MRVLLAAALLVILVLPPVAAYQETGVLSTTSSTHQWLMTRIPEILRSDGHGGLADLLEGPHLVRMREGTIRADETLWDSREHYMDPLSHEGFLGFRSSGDLASERFWLAVSQWAGGDRSAAMFNLGWAAHMVQDDTVPHHARLTAFDGHSEYEAWVQSHRTDYAVSSGGVYELSGNPHGVPLNTSDPFDWVDANAHQSYGLFQYVDGSAGAPGNDYAYVAGILLPLAQRTSAGFVKMFFDSVDAGPPVADAGGDLVVEHGTPAHLSGQTTEDDLGIETMLWDLGDGETAYGETVTHTYASPGTYHVLMTAADVVGKESEDAATVTVVDRTPPRAVAGPDVVAFPGEVVVLDGTASWDNVGVVNYTWSVAGDARYGPAVSASFDSRGIYRVDLTVRDAAGNDGFDATTVTVSPAPDAIRAIIGQRRLGAGEEGEFAIEWDGAEPRAVLWTFGDGGTAEAARVVHSFQEAGTYRVVAVAWDARNRTSREWITVEVSELLTPEDVVLARLLRVVPAGIPVLVAVLYVMAWRRAHG